MNLLDRLMANAEWAVAGLIGAVIAIPFHEELKTWPGRLYFIFTGVACAYFTTPLAISLYNIDPALAGCVGFLLGAFGGSLVAAIIRSIKSADIIGMIKSKWFGGDSQ